MVQPELSPPRPVDGIVFERSGVKTLVIALSCGFLFCVAACVTYAAATGHVTQRIRGLVGGIVGMVSVPLALTKAALSWWARRRLIVGQDRLQVIEYRKGEDCVVLQIPYANIDEFKYEPSKNRVGIDLYRLDDADTYALSEDFEKNKQTGKRHYSITFGYRGGPYEIGLAIEHTYSRWCSQSQTEDGNVEPYAKLEEITEAIDVIEGIDDEAPPKSPRIVRDIRRDPAEDALSTMIPYKNGRALTAYYLGVFSLIPCVGLLLGPAALVLGILGLRYVKTYPTAKGTGHAIAGIVLGGVTSLSNWGILLAFVVIGGIAALNK